MGGEWGVYRDCIECLFYKGYVSLDYCNTFFYCKFSMRLGPFGVVFL